ncbi:hypothetical protein FS837_001558 [Tulasnella sp. UAMH 9824]|nr:hypothetical protein FS837_001558 [Tulasnella sp. UAMH 9824]
MSLSYSLGKGALVALKELVTSFKGLTKGKQAAGKELRVSGVDLLRGLGGRNRSRRAKRNFVVLIFIKYEGWYRGSEGTSEPMQLDSVENDLVEVLRYLHYHHDDTETMWRVLADFDLEYTDETGNHRRVERTHPTKEAILDALREAGKTRRSGLVYFGGHGEYEHPGASVLKTSEGQTRYTVKIHEQSGPKSSYLLAIDGGRIYGDDIVSRLPEKVPTQCVHTVALDACHSSGLADAAGSLPHVYGGSSKQGPAETPEDIASAQQRSSKQLVIITAARKGELAKTVRPEAGTREFGALTWYTLHWLNKYPYATAENLGQRLHHTCADGAEEGMKQHPEIRARYSLTGSFELLPGLLHRDEVESSKAELPKRGFPIAQTWARLYNASIRRAPQRSAAVH